MPTPDTTPNPAITANPDATDIRRRRLLSQGLSGAPFATATDVVRWLGAVQSQEYAVAKWSVGQRATGLTDAGLDRALADGTLVRTHVLRPTWHFVAAADIRWMLALTAPRVHAANASYYRQYGLDEAVFAASDAELAAALAGGNELTRKEVTALLADAGITTENMAVGLLLMHAELEAVICSGGLRGKQRTYARFDERVPPEPPRDRDQALAELTRRYFSSHGPATRADFQWWSGLLAADAKRGLELARPDLAELVADDDRTYWYAAGDPPGRPDPSPTVHLLQGYDEYLVAYTGDRRAYDLAGARPAGSGAGAARSPYLHGVILDGQYAGTWRRTLKAKEMTIDVQLLRPFDDAEQAALAAAVARYAGFVGVPATLVVQEQPGHPR